MATTTTIATTVLPSNGGGRRLVLLPLPFQGHINPMLQLANILHSKAFSITNLHTRFNSPNPTNYPHFNFLPIPDAGGLQNHFLSHLGDVILLLRYLNTNFLGPIRDCLAGLMAEDAGVSCLITDAQWLFPAVFR